MSDDLTYWNDALAGNAPPIFADRPCAGYFKMKLAKDDPWLPVVIFTPKDGGAMIALIGAGKHRREASQIWTYAANKPVTREAAMHAFGNGNSWPGDAPEPTIGDNSGDLSLAEQVRDYAATALAWLRKHGIKDETGKNTVANMRQKLLDLRKRADTERVAEKQPHLDASRDVDAKYKPIIDDANDAANELRDALTVYMRDEEKRLQSEAEAKRKAEQKRIDDENARIAAERAQLMESDPALALSSPEPERLAPPPVEQVRVQAGGQRGRRTGLRTVTKFVLTDYAAALAHCKDHPAIREAVEKVCCAQAKAGAVVPGVEAREEKVAA